MRKRTSKAKKTNRRTAHKRPAMVISKPRRVLIEQLAYQLADLAPATSRGNSFCVRKVAVDHQLGKHWKDGQNKREMITSLLIEVFRQYPRMPKAIVLEIVVGGVAWRTQKGRAVPREELDAIVDTMAALGFDLKKEVEKIELPDPSRVRPPSLDLAGVLERLELHDALRDDCIQMFKAGHLNEAVRKGLERFEKFIQDSINNHDAQGKGLMALAFKKDVPTIQINPLKTANDKSEQEGFMHLTMGAMAGMRNIYSHGDVETVTPMDAFERLCFISLLFKRVEKALEDMKEENDG